MRDRFIHFLRAFHAVADAPAAAELDRVHARVGPQHLDERAAAGVGHARVAVQVERRDALWS